MLPSFSPRNLRIFENYPRKIFKDDFALILVFEPRHCSNPRNFSKLSFLRGIAHSELDSTFSSIFSKMTKLSNLQNFFFRAFLMLPRLVFRRKKKKFVIKTAVFQGLKLGLNTYFCFFFNTLLYRQDKLFNITLISRYLQKIFLDVLIRDTIRILLSI